MLDKSFIGHQFTRFKTEVEKGRLKFFAKAIGETNPVYLDESAARDAGYRTLPAPPSFAFSIDLDGPEFLPVIRVLKLNIAKILHGSQEFEYFGQIYAGDQISVTSEIKDIYDKKGGALEFVVMESTYTNQDGDLLVKATNTLVYRNS